MAINATAVWRVRPSGSNTNGGGYDAGISGAGTDYSQQNSAQASGTAGTGSGTTFTDLVAAAFTSAMVGNAIYLTGTGVTTGFYFVTAYTSSTVVTLDRSAGTFTGVATWYLGGGWADFWTNTTANVVPGNIIYILGSGNPNPSSYSFDYSPSTYFVGVSGNFSAGMIRYIGDPNTPSGGMPSISAPGLLFYQMRWIYYKNLWVACTGTSNQGSGVFGQAFQITLDGCVLDQYGYDMGFFTENVNLINCEVSSSHTARSGSTQIAIINGQGGWSGGLIWGNNIHDTLFTAVNTAYSGVVAFNVISKCGGDGIEVHDGSTQSLGSIFNNTIDNNLGHGIEFDDSNILGQTMCFNNIISNHTASGKYGMTVSGGTTAANNLIKGFVDYNTFYNNTTNYNAISAGAHDTAAGSTPYVSESANNWTLVSTFYNAGVTPSGPLPQKITGWNG